MFDAAYAVSAHSIVRESEPILQFPLQHELWKVPGPCVAATQIDGSTLTLLCFSSYVNVPCLGLERARGR